MNDTDKAEALAVYYDALPTAREHATEFLNDLGSLRSGPLALERMARKIAVSFTASEMGVDESEIEDFLIAEGV